jgi:hypothetical protein
MLFRINVLRVLKKELLSVQREAGDGLMQSSCTDKVDAQEKAGQEEGGGKETG